MQKKKKNGQTTFLSITAHAALFQEMKGITLPSPAENVASLKRKIARKGLGFEVLWAPVRGETCMIYRATQARKNRGPESIGYTSTFSML